MSSSSITSCRSNRIGQGAFPSRRFARRWPTPCASGGFLGQSQVAFGRVVTDYTRFGYLMDIFVLPEHRGFGHGKAIVHAICQHPDLRSVALMLRTSDAPALYEKFGFEQLPSPDKYMRRPAVPRRGQLGGAGLDPDNSRKTSDQAQAHDAFALSFRADEGQGSHEL
ncbi:MULTISPECIES: GNAT family N-acetyltransferase [unclassified Rhodanobacter]|uniref:GNAT family N-acetyltransferase n=1 Tax=unclassified Rhodanobacter TaxID=2621553 RepID=UPI0020322E1B|nr:MULTISPECIES: GNAT family N-acetyltransferase [unclassified Rhodanobacter]